MNLRLKTLLASSFTTMVLIAGLSTGLSFLILRQITQTEKNTLTLRMDEVLKQLQTASNPADSFRRPEPSNAFDPPQPPETDPRPLPKQTAVAVLINPAGQIKRINPGDARFPNLTPLSPELKQALTNMPAHWVSLPITNPSALSEGTQVGIAQTSQGLLLLTERIWSQEPDSEPLRLVTGRWLLLRNLMALGNAFT